MKSRDVPHVCSHTLRPPVSGLLYLPHLLETSLRFHAVVRMVSQHASLVMLEALQWLSSALSTKAKARDKVTWPFLLWFHLTPDSAFSCPLQAATRTFFSFEIEPCFLLLRVLRERQQSPWHPPGTGRRSWPGHGPCWGWWAMVTRGCGFYSW